VNDVSLTTHMSSMSSIISLPPLPLSLPFWTRLVATYLAILESILDTSAVTEGLSRTPGGGWIASAPKEWFVADGTADDEEHTHNDGGFRGVQNVSPELRVEIDPAQFDVHSG
jgi:hypothetical protein